MSLQVALWVLVWLAIIVVYLGLSAVLREVRMLRAQVHRLSATSSAPRLAALPTLPSSLVDEQPRVVLASDSRCPLCRVVLARLGERLGGLNAAPVLLTHESRADWNDVPAGITLVTDRDAWRQIAHLTPPVLMNVAASGAVTDLVLPSNETDVDTALARWTTEGA